MPAAIRAGTLSVAAMIQVLARSEAPAIHVSAASARRYSGVGLRLVAVLGSLGGRESLLAVT